MSLETTLIELIDAHLSQKGHTLSFIRYIDVTWIEGKWQLKDSTQADPFALLLVDKNPERVKNMDDDIVIATVANLIKKPAWYIRSFQDGWHGVSNSYMSIEAHLLGAKLRKLYWKAIE